MRIVVRDTTPRDWEYRYSAQIIAYESPETGLVHRCRLRPRVRQRAPEPVEVERRSTPPPTPPLPPEPPQRAPQRQTERRVVLSPVSALEKYAGSIE